jgi:lambda repressor-like predicted transcriptional regulator
MTEARRKAKIAMLEKGLTFNALASLVRLKRGTVHNILSDLSTSSRGRQAITNVLGANEIWPGVFTSERRLDFGPHVEIDSPSVERAVEFAKQFPAGFAMRRGKSVRFKKRFQVVVLPDDPPAWEPVP